MSGTPDDLAWAVSGLRALSAVLEDAWGDAQAGRSFEPGSAAAGAQAGRGWGALPPVDGAAGSMGDAVGEQGAQRQGAQEEAHGQEGQAGEQGEEEEEELSATVVEALQGAVAAALAAEGPAVSLQPQADEDLPLEDTGPRSYLDMPPDPSDDADGAGGGGGVPPKRRARPPPPAAAELEGAADVGHASFLLAAMSAAPVLPAQLLQPSAAQELRLLHMSAVAGGRGAMCGLRSLGFAWAA